jgi:hypothetical protein
MTAKVQVQQGLGATPGHDRHANSFLAFHESNLVFSLRVRQWNACDGIWFAIYDVHLARQYLVGQEK